MWRIVAILIILPIALFPAQTQDDDCASVVPPRLALDDGAEVISSTANNMRDSASLSGELVIQIPPGGQFRVLSDAVCADGYNWYEVYFDGVRGWTVEGDDTDYWLGELPEDAELPPAPRVFEPRFRDYLGAVNLIPRVGEVARVIVRNDETISLRDAPTTSGGLLVRLQSNDTVTILEEVGEADGFNWWQVETSNGTVGYMIDGFNDEDYQDAFTLTLLPTCPYTENRITFVGRVFAYDEANPDPEFPGQEHYGLFTADTDGENVCMLHYMPVLFNDFILPQWSPDGTQIAFLQVFSIYRIGGNTGDHTFYIINADGSNLRQLGTLAPVIWDFAWAPNGEQLAYIRWDQEIEIWRINVDGTNAAALTGPHNQTGDYRSKSNVQWSLDGTEIYFLDDDIGLRTINSDGSDLRTIGQPDQSPSRLYQVLPDGKIMYVMSRQGDIRIVDPTTGDMETISVDHTGDRVAAIAPDGSSYISITVVGENDKNIDEKELTLVNLETGENTMLWVDDSINVIVNYSPDSRYVYVASYQNAITRIDVTTLDIVTIYEGNGVYFSPIEVQPTAN